MTDDATYDELMRDLLEQVYLLECSRLGIVARMHGLFYILPLCHDAFGEGNP